MKLEWNTRKVRLDGATVVSGIPLDAFHYFRLIVEANGKPISWNSMLLLHHFDDDNQTRVKLGIPYELSILYESSKGKSPKLKPEFCEK